MMRRLEFTLSLTCVLCLNGLRSQCDAGIILSNYPGTGSFTGAVTNLGLGTDDVDRVKSVGLKTGAQDLSFVSLSGVFSNSDAFADRLSGGIYLNDAGVPGDLLDAFTPVSVHSGSSHVLKTLMTVSPFILLANTTYWFVLEGPSTVNNLTWDRDDANTELTATGVTSRGYLFSGDGGATWGGSGNLNTVQINADLTIPEPSSIVLTGFGMMVFAGVARRRKRVAT